MTKRRGGSETNARAPLIDMVRPALDPRGTLLVFGAGFIGNHVAKRAADYGYAVFGTTRRRERSKELAQQGVLQPLLFRGAEPLDADFAETHLSGVTHLLSTVPPSDGADPVLTHHRKMLEERLPSLQWVGHISTAAVYGEHGEIDATTVPRPGTYGERLRMLIEREWASLSLPPTADPVRIFRPASVYGPWRGPQQTLRQGRAAAIEKPGYVASRIHVDDVAAAILSSMEQSLGAGAGVAPEEGCPVEGSGCSTYLLADAEPASPADVLRYTAQLYGCPPPSLIEYPQIEHTLSAQARAFWSRPVVAKSESACAALGLSLAYPTYREGLAAVRDVEDSPIDLPPPPEPEPAPDKPARKPRAVKAATAKKATPAKATEETAAAAVTPMGDVGPDEHKWQDAVAARHDLELEIEQLRAELDVLDGAKPQPDSMSEASETLASLSREELTDMKVKELKPLLRVLKLPVSGRKGELIERLLQRQAEDRGAADEEGA